MTQHPIEQPTQPWYDPDGPPPPPPAGADPAAKPKSKGKKKPKAATEQKSGAAPEAEHEAHPIEHPTVPYSPGPGGGTSPSTNPGTNPGDTAPLPSLDAYHPNEQVTVNYGSKHPDENATERITAPDSHLTRPLNAAARAAATRTPKAPGPASGIRTPTPPTARVAPGSKSRLMAGLLAIFLGGLGVHRFYLGYPGVGLAMLVGSVFLSILSGGFLAWMAPAWGVVEGILYLTARKGYWSIDAKRVPLHD
ncbi:TM2 domain-containing protein [Antribacter gilvus]|uniref:TM2 domain-containing protein n=1 Tax=Antribacter gilvus TaxID=2304675 RepID=UPI001F0BB891|nr:TM2 domain-containing protein [Antribacter gilvus]